MYNDPLHLPKVPARKFKTQSDESDAIATRTLQVIANQESEFFDIFVEHGIAQALAKVTACKNIADANQKIKALDELNEAIYEHVKAYVEVDFSEN